MLYNYLVEKTIPSIRKVFSIVFEANLITSLMGMPFRWFSITKIEFLVVFLSACLILNLLVERVIAASFWNDQSQFQEQIPLKNLLDAFIWGNFISYSVFVVFIVNFHSIIIQNIKILFHNNSELFFGLTLFLLGFVHYLVRLKSLSIRKRRLFFSFEMITIFGLLISELLMTEIARVRIPELSMLTYSVALILSLVTSLIPYLIFLFISLIGGFEILFLIFSLIVFLCWIFTVKIAISTISDNSESFFFVNAIDLRIKGLTFYENSSPPLIVSGLFIIAVVLLIFSLIGNFPDIFVFREL